MFRKYDCAQNRKQRRQIGFEPLEIRTMMSANSIIHVNIPAAPTGMTTVPDINVATVAGVGQLPNYTVNGPYTPADIRNIYGINKLPQSDNGAGTTIAIIDSYDDPTIAQDLHTFDAQFGLPDPNLTVAKQSDGGTLPQPNQPWDIEISLDVEWAHAIAPAANILLCEAVDADLGNQLKMVDYARNYPGVGVVSMSFGMNEWGGSRIFFDMSQFDADQHFTTPSGHRPVTFIASSGDGGALAGVQYPASSPNVLAVGGTSLTAFESSNLPGGMVAPAVASTGPTDAGTMSYDAESAWSGSGGGYSAYESKPAYQSAVNPTFSRAVPDVAYDANPNTGFWIFDSSNKGWNEIGGTSAGAPQWAGIIALVNQGRANIGGDTLASAVSDIYALPATDFHDITTGNNGFYSATPGYDAATGRGTPVGNLLISDLIHAEGLVQPPPVGPIEAPGQLGAKSNAPQSSAAITPMVVTAPTSPTHSASSSALSTVSCFAANATPATHRGLDAADQLVDALLGFDDRAK